MEARQRQHTSLGLKQANHQPTSGFFDDDYAKPLLIGAGIITLGIVTGVVVRKIRNAGSRLVAAAKKYVGIKETGSNAGWDNAAFQAKMKAVGWWSGAAWCAFFVKMVVMEIAKGKAKEFFSKKISCNTQITWDNLQTPSEYHEVLKKPCVGCIVIYQGKTNKSEGHIEIIETVNKDGSYKVISGNDYIASGVQGVARKDRPKTGISKYNILGYIKIKKLK